jgi:hypothetical protein
LGGEIKKNEMQRIYNFFKIKKKDKKKVRLNNCQKMRFVKKIEKGKWIVICKDA